MNNNIKVSVIVPVYNGADYLSETAGYIKNQTLKEIEIIYVDDGSTDGTIDILNNLAKEDSRVIVLQQQNSYAGVARNKGLSRATGKYVVFWDADDIFLPEALQEMYEKCEQDNADICICGATHYDELTGRTLKNSTYLKKNKIPEKVPFGHAEIDECLFEFSTNVPWNKMYNKAFIEKYGLKYQEIKQANDNYFSMLAYFYAETFTIVDKALINYRINYKDSLTGKASQTPLCVYEAYRKTFDKLSKEPGFEQVRQSFLNKTLRAFFYFLSKQTTVEAYEILYNCYKNEVLQAWGFPTEMEYYHVSKDYDRYIRVLNMSASEFMLSEYRNAFNEVRILKDVKTEQKEKIRVLKEKNSKLKAKKEKLINKNEKLKETNSALSDKLKQIQESISYRIGLYITYIPRKIKENFVK